MTGSYCCCFNTLLLLLLTDDWELLLLFQHVVVVVDGDRAIAGGIVAHITGRSSWGWGWHRTTCPQTSGRLATQGCETPATDSHKHL